MTLESKLKEKTMASKWREFKAVTYIEYDVSSDGKSSWSLKLKEGKDPQKDGKHLIEKAALDEALELIGDLERDLQFINDKTTIYSSPSYKHHCYEALARIKAFKDRGSDGKV